MLRARRFRDLGKAASRTGPGTAPRGPASSPCKERHDTGNRQVVQHGEGLRLHLPHRRTDLFVRYFEIDGYGFRSLDENQHVEFEATPGPKGPQATRVRAA